MDKSITVPSVTAETDYIKTIEKSIEKESNSIVMSESKKKINRLDNVIRKINKKYELMFENVISSLGVSYTEEQKRNIISSLGYDAEIRSFIEEKEELENNLNTFKKSLTKA